MMAFCRVKLVDEIIPFDMKHNSEADACDLLMEVCRALK